MEQIQTPADAIRAAAKKVDGLAALGCAIGIDRAKAKATVWAWTDRNSVPVEHCAAIERVTDGAVRRWHLRPIDWHLIWPELIGTSGAPAVLEPSAGG